MPVRNRIVLKYPELYTDEQSAVLPAEEFLLVEDGSNFGWPYCYFDPAQNKKVLAPEYGGDGQIIERCSAADDPIMAFPAHTAPNDILFIPEKCFLRSIKMELLLHFMVHGIVHLSRRKDIMWFLCRLKEKFLQENGKYLPVVFQRLML